MEEFIKIGNLEWQVIPAKGTMNWQEAMDYAESKGWRLPTRGEMVDLFDNHYEEMQGLKDLDKYYWSDTTNSNDTQYAWGVYQYSGPTYNNVRTNSRNYRVRCVRSSCNFDDLSQEPPVPDRVIEFVRMYNCIAVSELDDILESLGDQKLLSKEGEKFRKELWTAFIKE